MITGQLIIRSQEMGHYSPISEEDDRVPVMVIGILAVPKDHPFNTRESLQFTVSSPGEVEQFMGVGDPEGGVALRVDTEAPVDISEECRGYRADQLLCRPLWGV